MTLILKHEEFRNSANDATIIVQQFVEEDRTPLWRYYVKYDKYNFIGGCSDSLSTRPSKKWLANRF